MLARRLRDSYAGDKMHTSKTLISAVALAAAVGLATPASAQHHRGGSEGSRGSSGSNHGSEHREAAAPRSAPPAQQQAQRAQPRAENQARGANGQRDNGQRAAAAQRPAPPATANGSRDARAYAVPRSYGLRALAAPSTPPQLLQPRLRLPRVPFLRADSFLSSVLSFRPRLSLGFGLWVGYPVPSYDPFYYPDTRTAVRIRRLVPGVSAAGGRSAVCLSGAAISAERLPGLRASRRIDQRPAFQRSAVPGQHRGRELRHHAG